MRDVYLDESSMDCRNVTVENLCANLRILTQILENETVYWVAMSECDETGDWEGVISRSDTREGAIISALEYFLSERNEMKMCLLENMRKFQTNCSEYYFATQASQGNTTYKMKNPDGRGAGMVAYSEDLSGERGLYLC